MVEHDEPDHQTTARIAALIPAPMGVLWTSMYHDLDGAPLQDVVAQLWQLDDGTDPLRPASSCASSEVGVVAGAVRWTAAAIGQHIQQVRDRRRQERDGAIERTDLIELY